MANGQYKKWLEPENLVLLRGWKRDGWTDEQIAQRIGIHYRTFQKWKTKYSPIGRAVKTGKENANFRVENKLLERALNGNMTAIIFWLKNNWRDKYNDSALSVEERKLAKMKIQKLQADTKRVEAETKRLDSGNNLVAKIVFTDDLKPDAEVDNDGAEE